MKTRQEIMEFKKALEVRYKSAKEIAATSKLKRGDASMKKRLKADIDMLDWVLGVKF